MKTKKMILGMVVAMGLIFTSCSQSGEKQVSNSTTEKETTQINSISIDTDQSRIIWSGEMLGVYTHEGTLKFKEMSITMNDGKITGGSFIADLKTIIPTDKNYNEEEGSTPEKLVGHLSSADFFDVENFPTAKYEITKVDGNTITGMLTIRGISHEEKVYIAVITKEGEKTKITGDLVFDRKKYDVVWDSPMKEMVLSNDVKLTVELIGS